MRRDHPIRRDRGWITPDYSLRLVKLIIIFSLFLSFRFSNYREKMLKQLRDANIEEIDNSKHGEYLRDG